MKPFEAIGCSIVVLVVVATLNLLMAFPFKWTWNYIMPTVFGLPEIGWLGAFCLLWVTHQILPSKIIDKN